jgi:branched-chain amino acid transport system ATP-binding protein
MQPSDPVLAVEDLGVSYGALVALEGVSWQVRAGEILGIIGPNGAGKSSCYDAVTHLVPRRGRIWLAGEDVTDVPAHRLAAKGLKRAFQQNAFFHELTVLENMVAVLQDRYGSNLLASLLLPMREARYRATATQEATLRLERFGVPADYHHLKPTHVPYGIQRMLSIALAYGSGARVLLLDEPAAGLGGADMQRLVDLLVAIKSEGLALVVIEHHMDLIMSVADSIIVLDQGLPLAVGSPSEIQSDARVIEAYLGRAA